RHSHHSRVRHVHVLHVPRAAPITGHPHVARTQGKPCNSRQAAAEPDRHTESAAAHKPDKRWRIDRPHNERARHPTPVAAYERPAAVMKGRKPPRLIANPRPAPRRDPYPMT